jgi:hypothetical protein
MSHDNDGKVSERSNVFDLKRAGTLIVLSYFLLRVIPASRSNPSVEPTVRSNVLFRQSEDTIANGNLI